MDRCLDEVYDAWLVYNDAEDLPSDWTVTVTRLVRAGLVLDDFMEASEATAHFRARDPWRYFCGVALNILGRRQDEARKLLDAGL